MRTIISLIAIPLMALNLLGGIVSGVWLAILGEWGSIGYGLIAIFGSVMLLSIALLPSMLFAMPAIYFGNRGKWLGVYFFTLLSCIYTAALITAWCRAVLYFFSSRADADSVIPLMIWSYGVALSPWQFMAQKDAQSGNDTALFTTAFAQIGYVVMVLAALLFRVTLFDVMKLFAVIMAVGLIIQFSAVIQAARAERAY